MFVVLKSPPPPQPLSSLSLLKVDTQLEGEYVDMESFVWRTLLYPTKVDLLLEHQAGSKVRVQLSTTTSNSSLNQYTLVYIYM